MAMAVIKSWANVWTTSARMNEDDKLPCVFGCDDRDTLSHYIQCEPFWSVLITCSYRSEVLLHDSPLKRLCLLDPSLEQARLLTIAFSCYHALKLGHRELVQLGCDSGCFDDTLAKLVCLADAYARELM